MPATISPGFRRLLQEPAYCQLATLMPDGSPQITQVWVDTDGEHILINTAEGRQKERNVRRGQRGGPGERVSPAHFARWFASLQWPSHPRGKESHNGVQISTAR